jgi:hypothetical protein
VLALSSAVMLFVLMLDVFITVFSSNGAGPLTKIWYLLAWRGLLAIHKHRTIHRLLSLAGPLMLVTSVLLWYAMLAVALFLALASLPGLVVNNITGEPASLWEIAYFVSTTISSLGYGDLVPSGFPWTIISTISTLGGTIIITISLSYVLSVLAAAIDRRKLAQGIFGLGETAPEIIEHAKLHDPQQSLKNYILNLTSQIDHQALRHSAYPILNYFHSSSAQLSPSRAILLLSDTFFLLSILPEEKRPPAGVLYIVDGSIAKYVEYSKPNLIDRTGQQLDHLRDTAHALGVTSTEKLEGALEDYLPRRNLLVAICKEDGWHEQ